MLKPAEIRRVITAANESLRRDPDRLLIFIDEGRVVCRGGHNLSYEYRYTLNIIVTDYPHHADRIILPMLAWLRRHQPDLFENFDRGNDAIRFQVEVLNQQTVDISIEVDLTERVIVTHTGQHLTAEHNIADDLPDLPRELIEVEVINRKTDETLGTFCIEAWNPSTFGYE